MECYTWDCHPVVSVAYPLLSSLLTPVWEWSLCHPCDFSWNRLHCSKWVGIGPVIVWWHMTRKETPFDVEHSLTWSILGAWKHLFHRNTSLFQLEWILRQPDAGTLEQSVKTVLLVFIYYNIMGREWLWVFRSVASFSACSVLQLLFRFPYSRSTELG